MHPCLSFLSLAIQASRPIISSKLSLPLIVFPVQSIFYVGWVQPFISSFPVSEVKNFTVEKPKPKVKPKPVTRSGLTPHHYLLSHPCPANLPISKGSNFRASFLISNPAPIILSRRLDSCFTKIIKVRNSLKFSPSNSLFGHLFFFPSRSGFPVPPNTHLYTNSQFYSVSLFQCFLKSIIFFSCVFNIYI